MYEIEEKINIKDLIYEIRGKEVMLDSDLAKLYGCNNGTKDINKAVKRNIERFPGNFYFQLSKQEALEISRFQFGTLNKNGDNRGYNVLRTKDAARVSVNIMNAFVEMRKFINENKDLFKRIISIENKTEYIESTLLEFDNNFKILFDKFDRKEDLKSKLFFNGEIYDAYSCIIDIIKEADKKIIIIDSYIDESVLKFLSKKNLNVMVLLITSNKAKINNFDIHKFNKQYPSIEIKYTDKFHDRFIIIDNKKLYHLGTSLNYIGNKVFGINKIEDTNYLILLLDIIKNL